MGKQSLLVSEEASHTYMWIDWIVCDNHSLNFCEKERVHRHTKGNLKPITVKTLTKYMHQCVEVMETNFRKSLPKKFGVALDGWSDSGVHYLAIFAVGPSVPQDGKVLLGFSPFEQPDDLTAEQHELYLAQVLNYYDRLITDLLFICGDNCNTNKKIATDLSIPLFGCNCWRNRW